MPPAPCIATDVLKTKRQLRADLAWTSSPAFRARLGGDVFGERRENGTPIQVNSTDLRQLRAAVEGDAIRITVTDRGDGIAAADLERIFLPFHTRKSDGLGLGLAVCRTIVLAHRG